MISYFVFGMLYPGLIYKAVFIKCPINIKVRANKGRIRFTVTLCF